MRIQLVTWLVILWTMSIGGVAWGQDLPSPPQPAVHTEYTDDGIRIVPDRQVPVDASEAERLMLEFGDTTLYDLTLFFSDVLRRNMLLSDDAPLKAKKVTLIGHETMTLDAAWEAYLSALRAHGFTTSVVGELVTIVPSTEASSRSEEVRAGPPELGGERIITQLLPVANGQVSDLLPIVKPLLSEDAEVIAYAPANTLIVTDSANNVLKIADLVAELAVAAPTTELKLYPLDFAQAEEVKAVIVALYPEVEKGSGRASSSRGARSSRRGRRTAPEPEPTTAGSRARHITTIIEHERTNALLVLANADGHAAVQEIIEQLDVDHRVGRSTLHVLRLTYALAEEVQTVLAELQQSGTSDSSTRTGRNGRRPTGRAAVPADASPDLARALDNGARIASDPATNSLAILAEPEDFRAIADLVAELDVARRQVFVDAVFVDLTRTDGKEASLSAHLLGNESNPAYVSSQTDSSGSGSFSVSTDLLSGLAAGVFGPLVSVIGADGSALEVPVFGIALKALQTDSNVHVMGNPALLAIDHQEATLTVGRKIPFPVSSTLSAFGSPVLTYDRIDVATELKVTPHINDETLVTLDVSLVVDEVESGSSETDLDGGPVTSGRSVESKVMVEDGQTVIIAGVTSTKLETSRTKVPVLGDIPLLGLLFRGKRTESRNSNLLVFLTPYIVETPADVLRVRRIKEAQRQEFVRRFQGKDGQAWLSELKGLLEEAYDPPAPDPM